MVAPEISHILFTYFDFIFFLHLLFLKVLSVLCEWLKSLNFERLPFWCPKFCQILFFS